MVRVAVIALAVVLPDDFPVGGNLVLDRLGDFGPIERMRLGRRQHLAGRREVRRIGRRARRRSCPRRLRSPLAASRVRTCPLRRACRGDLIDWQIKVTPELNINYVHVGETGILYPDVRRGNTRLDAHAGLQEGFFEVKLKDLSHNFDFVSVRAGIQTFNSDFRGFIFNDQEPGVSVFGNLRNNKFQYNAAYFAMLEKDSNSGLNRFKYRQQQVFIANLYRQDFIRPGYTIQGSYHFNKDDAGSQLQFDTNGFLVRPAPVGNFNLHTIRAHYIGLTADGHIGRLNIDSAFYQALGHDSANAIAGFYQSGNSCCQGGSGRNPANYQTINAQMAALELSIDRDWMRYRVSGFFSSGDGKPRDGIARGFDTIFDNSNFAGGFFSFWNREGIRLLGTGVGLVQGNSIVPSLRSSKIEGQANFVNPGIIEYNASSDIDITPKLNAVLNLNLIRFHHTEPLELLLFQKTVQQASAPILVSAWCTVLLCPIISCLRAFSTSLLPSRALKIF